MKTYRLLITSLLSFITLISCGANKEPDVPPTPDPSKYMVTKQEYNDAIYFKDIEYAQMDETTESKTTRIECSPNVYHKTFYSGVFYGDEYVKRISDEEYRIAHRDSIEGKFEFEKTDAESFITPQSDVFTLEYAMIQDAKYEDFCFYPTENCYRAQLIVASDEECNITLKFEDKKLTYFETDITDSGHAIRNYSYLNITPEFPSECI